VALEGLETDIIGYKFWEKDVENEPNTWITVT